MTTLAPPASARDIADARADRRFRWILTATALFVLVTLLLPNGIVGLARQLLAKRASGDHTARREARHV